MAANGSGPGVSVTTRALSVLGAFDTGHPSLRLSEIARRADLPLATAHRLVGELTGWGALSRRDDGGYVIGRRLWDLGLLAPATDLVEAASPFLHDIHAATRATVHLAVRDDLHVLYLDRVSGSVSVPVVSRVGSRLPLHATGVGKVLLAHAPVEIRTAALARLQRITPYTIHPARPAARAARPRRPGRLRADLGGDEPGRVLGRGARARQRRPGLGRPGDRRDQSSAGSTAPGRRPAGRRGGHPAGPLTTAFR